METSTVKQRLSKQEGQLKWIENRLDRSRAAESPQEEVEDMVIGFGEGGCKEIQSRTKKK
jgi:hypothetical protein